jgi:hypothetical protein
MRCGARDTRICRLRTTHTPFTLKVNNGVWSILTADLAASIYKGAGMGVRPSFSRQTLGRWVSRFEMPVNQLVIYPAEARSSGSSCRLSFRSPTCAPSLKR